MPSRLRRRREGILTRAVQLLRTHDLLMMGAGIAFFFTLALIPLLLLGTSAVGFALGSSRDAAARILPALRPILPGATAARIEAIARSLVERRVVAGWLGILAFLWVASGAYDAIANALTTLSGLRESRSYLHRKLVAFCLMIGTGSLFLASLVLTSIFAAVIGFGTSALSPLLPSLVLRAPGLALWAGPPLLVTVIFAIQYRWGTPRPIPWGPAFVGASVGGILWYISKLSFGWSLLRFVRHDLVSGLMGGLIGLLLWIYYTSVIFLCGAVVALACWRDRPGPDGH